MKKKIIAVMISLMLTASLAGCSGEISNDYITITQYKDLEVPQVESTEVTEEKIENVINSNLELAATKESVTDRRTGSRGLYSRDGRKSGRFSY